MTDHIDELQRKACADPCFTPDEKGLIREMIRIYRGWLFVIKVGKGGLVALAVVAAGIASWGTVKEALVAWLQ